MNVATQSQIKRLLSNLKIDAYWYDPKLGHVVELKENYTIFGRSSVYYESIEELISKLKKYTRSHENI